MIAQGFKPVGWVAAVAGAALGCYMLSLNVAAERAELAKIERQIIAAKQEIRTLQTELGTRGRMQQLEHWNAEVLALSAPTAAQFLDNPVTLARFETQAPTIEEKAKVTMAAAEVKAPAPKPEIAAGRKLSPADYAKVAERAAEAPQPKVRLAAAEIVETSRLAAPVVKAAAVKLPAETKVKNGNPAASDKPSPKPFGLSLSKPSLSSAAAEKKEKPSTSSGRTESGATASKASAGQAAKEADRKPARTEPKTKVAAKPAETKPAKVEAKPAKKEAAKTGTGA
jgi:hypothetical protein